MWVITTSLSQWILVGFCFLLQIVILGRKLYPNTACCFTTLLSTILRSRPRPVIFGTGERTARHIAFTWRSISDRMPSQECLFWVRRNWMGWSKLLVNLRGAYYSIYMWNDFCLSFLRVSGSALKLGSLGVWRTAGAEQKNHPPGLVHTGGPTKWNHLVWNVVFAAFTVTFESL